VEANILVSAIGVFTAPKLPAIPGLEEFPADRAIHVARWPAGLEKEQLKRKAVAVIGNGCRSQLVASLAEDPEIQVIALSRSAQWVTAKYVCTPKP
jgi:cation diffusion facilitator CzcD-associated flavoprotein CzcO